MEERLFYLRGWLFVRRQLDAVLAVVLLGLISHYSRSGALLWEGFLLVMTVGVAWYTTLAFMLNEGRVHWPVELGSGGWRLHLVRLLMLVGYALFFHLVILVLTLVLFMVMRGHWGAGVAVWWTMGTHLALTFAATIIWGPILPQVVDGEKSGLRAARRRSRGQRWDMFLLILRGPFAAGICALMVLVPLAIAASNGSSSAGFLASVLTSLALAYTTAMTAAILTEVYRQGSVPATPAPVGGAGYLQNKKLDYAPEPGKEDV